jgi:hypothetical protein
MDAAVDWVDLEDTLRKAVEAVRLTPRSAPSAIELAASALKNARARVASASGPGAADLARGLAEAEAACRAAGERLPLAVRYLDQAQTRLASLHAG